MTEPSERLLTVRETCERLAWARTTIYAKLKTDPSFPRPIKLSSGATRFSLREIEAFIASRSRTVSAVRNPEYLAKKAFARASGPESGEHRGTSVEVTAEAT